MRHRAISLVAIAYAALATVPASATYILTADFPFFYGSGMTVPALYANEFPCTRPNVSLEYEVWAFPSIYAPGTPLYGYRLTTQPMPAVIAYPNGGPCRSQIFGTTQVPIPLPPQGNYYITYFVLVSPSTACISLDGYCYDSYLTPPGLYSQTVATMPQPPLPAPQIAVGPPTATAVEYYHAAFDHYFVTAFSAEIAALDAGQFAGWTRTGFTFKVWQDSTGGPAGVCRFFSVSFAPKSSHFYTPFAFECNKVKMNPDWQFEVIAGFVVLPDNQGNCSQGQALYRLYNNGMGGAPNHRYTNNLLVRSDMISKGWIPEGNGPLAVIACIPQ